MRFGIGRPPGRMDAAAFVLRDFGAAERTGGNATAARLAGVNVPLTLMLAYAIAGAMAALAGVLQVAFISAASPVGSANVIFDATAAVLLGGTGTTPLRAFDRDRQRFLSCTWIQPFLCSPFFPSPSPQFELAAATLSVAAPPCILFEFFM